MRHTRTSFAAYNAEEFYRALDAGRVYPEAWIHLASWWRLTGAAPAWPERPPARMRAAAMNARRVSVRFQP